MLDGFSATMAQRRLSRCIFGPRGSHSWRADGEIMRRDCVFQGREFTKRSLIESNAIRVEDYGLFGEAVIVNPQQAEVMLSDGRHDYGLWPKLIRRMSSVQLEFKFGHLVRTRVKRWVDLYRRSIIVDKSNDRKSTRLGVTNQTKQTSSCILAVGATRLTMLTVTT
jgi:hypothetical protein